MANFISLVCILAGLFLLGFGVWDHSFWEIFSGCGLLISNAAGFACGWKVTIDGKRETN